MGKTGQMEGGSIGVLAAKLKLTSVSGASRELGMKLDKLNYLIRIGAVVSPEYKLGGRMYYTERQMEDLRKDFKV